jgi:hypothetical protein
MINKVYELIENSWSFVYQIAPKDDAPVPCYFLEPIRYLSMSHGEAVPEYLELLSGQSDADLAKTTKIMELLCSPLETTAFVLEK